MKNLPRNEFIVRSLTYVRDDKYVILKGFALKNLPPSESTIATVTSRKEEIPRRPFDLTRNDSGATEEHRRPMMHHRFTNKGQLHGEASMPAFIGPHEAREKEERGRGLFERNEFRSPQRRSKQRVGIPDNKRATFLDYFFAAGKK